MSEVVSQRLWIGNARDARNPRALLDTGIDAVVDLAYEEPAANLPRNIVYCRFPLIDGSGNDERLLKLALHSIAQLHSTDTPTLVACGAGMSRAPALTAAALSVLRREAPEQALKRLAESHPHDVSLALWQDLAAICRAVDRNV